MAGYKAYTQDAIATQENSNMAQAAANEGVSIDGLSPEQRRQAKDQAHTQLAQSNSPLRSNLYGNVSGYTQDQITRQRLLGESAAGRVAYQQNFGDYNDAMGQANAARNQQSQALDLQRQAALGNAPSQAEILGRQMADQGIASQMSMAASARGGALAQASAMRQAQNGQATFAQQAQNQIMAQRADEMAQARNAYMQGASGMRQQDYAGAAMGLQRTGMETQNELAQRQMNQSAKQFYEGQANNIYSNQLQADMGVSQLQQQQAQYDQTRSDQQFNQWVGTGAGVAASLLMMSDERAKTNIRPTLANTEAPKDGTSTGKKQALAQLVTQLGQGFGSMMSDERAKTARGIAAVYGENMGRGDSRKGAEESMAGALRSMEPYSYEYKPSIAELEGQEQGERNVGPMAQRMAHDPIARTALVRRPDGYLAIDKSKALKLTMGGLASLQREVDELKGEKAGEADRSGPPKYARGGAFDGQHPILVGEEGPELIVPQKPGYVMTAQQTAALRGEPPTDKQAASIAALYGSNHTASGPVQRPSLAGALAGIEHLKAAVGRRSGLSA